MPKKTSPVNETPSPAASPEGNSVYPPPEDGIGERIKKRREELRLNFQELSRLTAICDQYGGKGISPAMLARYESGAEGKPVLPGARELRILASSLNMPVDLLVLGADRYPHSSAAVTLANKFLSLLQRTEGYVNLNRTPEGAVEVASQWVAVLDAAAYFSSFDPIHEDINDAMWQQKLARVRKPRA